MSLAYKTLPLAKLWAPKFLSSENCLLLCRSSWLMPSKFTGINQLRGPTIIAHNQASRTFASASPSNQPSKTKRSMWLAAIGFTLGAALGLGYAYNEYQKRKIPIANNLGENRNLLLEEPPKPVVARRIVNPDDKSGLQLTLYQYQACPFCTKVRVYLDFAGISYDVVEVNPVTKQQLRWSRYKKVPTVIASLKEGYQQLNDSSMIISALESYLQNETKDLLQTVSYYPQVSFRDDTGSERSEILNRYFLMFGEKDGQHRTKESIVEERPWRKWADDVLSHTLSPNIYRTWEEAVEAFNLFSKNGDWERLFSSWERQMVIYVGAGVMYLIGRRLKKRHNLLDDVRQALYQEVNHFLRAVEKKGTPFMGGNDPDLADLAVFAYLNSIEGTRAFADLVSNSKVEPWYDGVKQVIAKRKGHVVIPS